jgi:hypothetical protein
MPLLLACSKDEPESDLYDWRITKSIYYIQTNNKVCKERWNEYLYDKSVEYVKQDKAKFEKNSTKAYSYVYAYHKLN